MQRPALSPLFMHALPAGRQSPCAHRCKLPAKLSACAVTLNANRQVTGVLRGFDQFMNLVLDSTVDEKLKQDIGMVVSPSMGAAWCSKGKRMHGSRQAGALHATTGAMR